MRRHRGTVALALATLLLAGTQAAGAIELAPEGRSGGTLQVVVLDTGSLQVVRTYRLDGRTPVLVSQTVSWYADSNGDGLLTPGEAYDVSTIVYDGGS